MKAVLFILSFAALCLAGRPAFAAPSLDGAWQPKYYGTRVEIAGDDIVILWRGAPVLETKFTVSGDGGKMVLRLEKTGLRLSHARRDYATVTGCWVEDARMHLALRYDITGDDEEILTPTAESRYGDVTMVTEKMMPYLEGVWHTEDYRGNTLEIRDGRLRWREDGGEWNGPVEIVVVRDNGAEDKDRYAIFEKDGSPETVADFQSIEYRAGTLIARIPVTGGAEGLMDLVFEKE